MPCGKCLACRYEQAKTWSLRIKLESLDYDPSLIQFVTLTYDSEFYPGELVPADLSSFIKRLRKNSGLKFRYFACGEYGSKRGRAHYHLILFGVKFDEIAHLVGISKMDYVYKKIRPFKIGGGYNVAWTKGFVDVQTAMTAGAVASYVAHYVTGKVENYAGGREPEFHRCSLGLGRSITEKLPFYTPIIKIGESFHFLGRYLRNKLAERFNCLDSVIQQSIQNLSEKMVEIVSKFTDNCGYYAEALNHKYRLPFALENFSYKEYISPAKDLLISLHKIKKERLNL